MYGMKTHECKRAWLLEAQKSIRAKAFSDAEIAASGIVRGGQGRTDKDACDTCNGIWWAFVLFIVVMLLVLLPGCAAERAVEPETSLRKVMR